MLAPGCWIHASERPPPLSAAAQPALPQATPFPSSRWFPSTRHLSGQILLSLAPAAEAPHLGCVHACGGAAATAPSAGCASVACARALRITCTCLGLFQGRQPRAPPVVTPSVEPCAASRCLPAMAQLTITARMTVPQVRPGGAKGWAGPPPPGRRRRAHAPPASSRSASLSLPLQPALRRARVYWDLGERPSRCWSAADRLPLRSACVSPFCASVAPMLRPFPLNA